MFFYDSAYILRDFISDAGKFMRQPGGYFTNISRALQKNLTKIYNARSHIYRVPTALEKIIEIHICLKIMKK